MENKYYTPSIEDLHVGYECEIEQGILIGGNKTWKKYTLLKEDNFHYYYNFIKLGHVRTPYLTKEEIEKQGWEYVDFPINEKNYFRKSAVNHKNEIDGYYVLEVPIIENIRIDSNIAIHKGFFTSLTKHFIFIGVCPSINEFRKLMKLLNIK